MLLVWLVMSVTSLVATTKHRQIVMLLFMKYLSEKFRYKKAFRVRGRGAVSWWCPTIRGKFRPRPECCDSRFEAWVGMCDFFVFCVVPEEGIV